ncbi:MAG: hypothetical protein IJ026_02110 [Candidatus Methanomethylophilaceae archaeon]|nr:hypothetical protein [Candidatus Methanomethylophilaceae archaeon]
MLENKHATGDGIPRVYLDNCCYGRPYDDNRQQRVRMESGCKVEIQGMIRRGELTLVSSSFLIWENNRRRDLAMRDSIYQFIHGNTRKFVFGTEDPSITRTMNEVRSHGIETMDAYHISSAIYAGCDYLITTDDKMLRYKVDGMEIVTPVQFIMRSEGNEIQR